MQKTKPIQIALLGFGTVGQGVYHLYTHNKSEWQKRIESPIQIKKILIKNKHKRNVPANLLTHQIDEILNDREIKIVIEMMGGVDKALPYIRQALKSGKHVITANKELIAKHGTELLKIASQNQVHLFFDASVAGGIPIIQNLMDTLYANQIQAIYGIINGTTNYILSEMSLHKRSYAEALAAAQKLGYAEADPIADVEGYDAAYKLQILGMIAFHSPVKISQIPFRGITQISADDIRHAKEFGFCIKLLAIGKRHGTKVELRVGPHLVPLQHPLASVQQAMNAVFIIGNATGESMFYGQGAGSLPTASAIWGDLLQVIRLMNHPVRTAKLFKSLKRATLLKPELYETGYLVRLLVHDKPGVLSTISGIFAKSHVSIENASQQGVGQKETELMIISYPSQEKNFQSAIQKILRLPVVHQMISCLPIANF